MPGGVAGCVLEAGVKGLIEQRLKKKDACILTTWAMTRDAVVSEPTLSPLLQTINNQFYNSQCVTPFMRNITASPTVNLPRELVQER